MSSKEIYIGVGAKARKVKKMYLGVGGVARTVKHGFVGVENIARMFFQNAIPVAYPTQAGIPAYTGSQLSPVWNNYDDTQITIGGIYKATNAGTYEATFTPKDGYCWPDGTTSAISVEWNIEKGILGIPYVTGTYTYSGSSQSVVMVGYDSSTMVRSGQTSSTDAGRYPFSVSLKDTKNYEWEDGSNETKNYTWNIDKAIPQKPVLSLSSKEREINVSRDGDGEIHASSSNNNITAAIDGTVITFDTIESTIGSGTITVTVGEGKNYFAYSDNDVKCNIDVNSYSMEKRSSRYLPNYEARAYMAGASVGDYALFAGGSIMNSYGGTSQTYTNKVTSINSAFVTATNKYLSSNMTNAASVSTEKYALFANTSVNAFNASLVRNDLASLPDSASYNSGTTVGEYALFACGNGTMRAYNASLIQSSGLSNINAHASTVGTASFNGYAMYAGGAETSSYPTEAYGSVFTYNSSLVRSTTGSLYSARTNLTGGSNDYGAYFSGGILYSKSNAGVYTGTCYSMTDYYSPSFVHNIATSLSVARFAISSTTVGGNVLFAGGRTASASNNYGDSQIYNGNVDMYTSTGVHGAINDLSEKVSRPAAATLGKNAFFAGGQKYSGASNTMAASYYINIYGVLPQMTITV